MDSDVEDDDSGEHLSIKETRKLLGVTTPTLRRWAETGKIGFSVTPTGRRLYNKQDVLSIIDRPQIPKPSSKKKIAYCRVSSKKQEDDLSRQKEFFRSKFPGHQLVTDIGSGINWKRPGLQTILELSMSGKVEEVVVAHRDRLCRFAFELIEFILSKNGVKLHVLESDSQENFIDQELSEDIMSIIHVYSCRAMGRRRYQKDSQNKETSNLSQSITKKKT